MGKPDNGNKALTAERRRRAWELYKAGVTSCRAIGQAIGCGKSSANRYIRGTLAELQRETLEDAQGAVATELARLDAQLAKVWTEALKGNLRAHEVVLRIADHRAKLLGLYRPVKVATTGPDGNESVPSVLVIVKHQPPPDGTGTCAERTNG